MVVLPAAQEVSAARFPRSARLLTPAAYAAVFEQRRARRGRFFHLHIGQVLEADSGISCQQGARLGIAVPKKLLKTAVHRNLVKRLARESFRQLAPALDQRDYVLRLSIKLDPAKLPLDRKALTDDIRSLFSGRSATKPVDQSRTVTATATDIAGQNRC